MSQGNVSQRSLSWLDAAVLEQASRHSTFGEPAAKRGGAPCFPNDDSVIDGLEIDIDTRSQADPLAEILWDDHLSLGSYTLGHTASV